MVFRPIVLIVRDGWGHSTKKEGNAIAQAYTPNHDHYVKAYPTTLLKCTGNAVGLPKGIQGGSEVGHLTMGAGRVVWQPLELINRAIRDKSFFENKVLIKAVENCKKNKSALHLMGLFSDQGVHGTIDHIYPILELAKKHNLKEVYIHAFLDGRDVHERSAHKYILEVQRKARKIGVGKIVTLIGRYYAMDRDGNWERIKKAYDLLVHGKGFRASSTEQGVFDAYERGDKTDYYVQPTLIVDGEVRLIQDKDSVIFYNFRSDRTRQLTALLTGQTCPVKKKNPKTYFVCMSEYDKTFKLPVAFPQQYVTHNLGNVISKAGLKQMRIAETEKYAHVTYFFNSQNEKANPKEERMLVHSPKVPSYDLSPAMSAPEVTEKALAAVKTKKYDFILINFANADLVGHSGNLKATVECCDIVDFCVGKIVDLVLKQDGVVLLTGDHGNAEQMIYPNGDPCPAHTQNPIPFTVISNHITHELHKGGLQDVAPTVLRLFDIEKPAVMTGKSLV